MTPQDIIDEARVLINDDNALMDERFTDAVLLGFVNQAVKRACAVRPDLFVVATTDTPTAGDPQHELGTSVIRIVQIHGIVSGDALIEADKETMDACYPAWRTETSGTPVNWMRHPRNPRGYFLYPRPVSGTVLDVEVIQVPDDYDADDDMILADSYKTALIDCVVFLAEIVDDETALSERGKAFYNSFLQALNADFIQRETVDEDHGNVGKSQRRRGNEQ